VIWRLFAQAKRASQQRNNALLDSMPVLHHAQSPRKTLPAINHGLKRFGLIMFQIG
jgi:hypothetical protein